MADFEERMQYLEDEVGHGDIVAGCLVNQPYAQDQHETTWYHHDVGRSHYLSAPLAEERTEILIEVGQRIVTEDGSDIKKAMVDVAEKMSLMVNRNAPVLYSRLRFSGQPWVTDEGAVIYHRPPVAPREEDSDTGWDRRR